MIERHHCRPPTGCTCYPLATEPSEACPIHGAGEYPPRCWRCGRYLKRGGFTLIEIIIAIVLTSLLATIAIPKYQSHRRHAFVASAQVELRILHQTQEMYFVDATTYAPTLSALDFQTSAKIPVVLVESTGMGWAATSTYENTTVRCAIFYGTVAVVPPPATALDEGVPVCTF